MTLDLTSMKGGGGGLSDGVDLSNLNTGLGGMSGGSGWSPQDMVGAISKVSKDNHSSIDFMGAVQGGWSQESKQAAISRINDMLGINDDDPYSTSIALDGNQGGKPGGAGGGPPPPSGGGGYPSLGPPPPSSGGVHVIGQNSSSAGIYSPGGGGGGPPKPPQGPAGPTIQRAVLQPGQTSRFELSPERGGNSRTPQRNRPGGPSTRHSFDQYDSHFSPRSTTFDGFNNSSGQRPVSHSSSPYGGRLSPTTAMSAPLGINSLGSQQSLSPPSARPTSNDFGSSSRLSLAGSATGAGVGKFGKIQGRDRDILTQPRSTSPFGPLSQRPQGTTQHQQPPTFSPHYSPTMAATKQQGHAHARGLRVPEADIGRPPLYAHMQQAAESYPQLSPTQFSPSSVPISPRHPPRDRLHIQEDDWSSEYGFHHQATMASPRSRSKASTIPENQISRASFTSCVPAAVAEAQHKQIMELGGAFAPCAAAHYSPREEHAQQHSPSPSRHPSRSRRRSGSSWIITTNMDHPSPGQRSDTSNGVSRDRLVASPSDHTIVHSRTPSPRQQQPQYYPPAAAHSPTRFSPIPRDTSPPPLDATGATRSPTMRLQPTKHAVVVEPIEVVGSGLNKSSSCSCTSSPPRFRSPSSAADLCAPCIWIPDKRPHGSHQAPSPSALHMQYNTNNMIHCASPNNNMTHCVSPINNLTHCTSPSNNLTHRTSPTSYVSNLTHRTSPHRTSPSNHMTHRTSPSNKMTHCTSPGTLSPSRGIPTATTSPTIAQDNRNRIQSSVSDTQVQPQSSYIIRSPLHSQTQFAHSPPMSPTTTTTSTTHTQLESAVVLCKGGNSTHDRNKEENTKSNEREVADTHDQDRDSYHHSNISISSCGSSTLPPPSITRVETPESESSMKIRELLSGALFGSQETVDQVVSPSAPFQPVGSLGIMTYKTQQQQRSSSPPLSLPTIASSHPEGPPPSISFSQTTKTPSTPPKQQPGSPASIGSAMSMEWDNSVSGICTGRVNNYVPKSPPPDVRASSMFGPYPGGTRTTLRAVPQDTMNAVKKMFPHNRI